jgi:hypothetical protein
MKRSIVFRSVKGDDYLITYTNIPGITDISITSIRYMDTLEAIDPGDAIELLSKSYGAIIDICRADLRQYNLE